MCWAGWSGPCYQIINQMFSAVRNSSIENLRWQSRARLFLTCIVTKVLENGNIMATALWYHNHSSYLISFSNQSVRSSTSLESVFKLVTRHNMYTFGIFLLEPLRKILLFSSKFWTAIDKMPMLSKAAWKYAHLWKVCKW